MSTKVSVVIVLATLSLGLVFAILLTQDDEPEPPRNRPLDSSSVAHASRDRTSPAEIEEDVTTRQASNRETIATPDSPSRVQTAEEYRGNGRIRLTFVDEATGAPIPDLGFAIFSERPRYHLLGRGRSNSKGRAELLELPEDNVLIETQRLPPHASTLSSVWLWNGEEKDWIVRVGRGGSVEGRVVDDRHEPIADAEISIDWGQKGWTEDATVVATTNADGNFTVDALHSRPRSVWFVDGEPRPERWVPVSLRLRSGESEASIKTHVKSDEVVTLGDAVIPRDRCYRGRVIDSAGAAVSNAFVGRGRAVVDRDRDALGSPQACLTDEQGGFEVILGNRAWSLSVHTEEGYRQEFRAVELPPGESAQDVVLQLSPHTLLTVDLKDEEGETVVGPKEDIAQGGVTLPNFERGLRVRIKTLDGKRLFDRQPKKLSDGRFRAQFKVMPSQIASLTLFLGGYRPHTDLTIQNRLRITRDLEFVMASLSSVRLNITVENLERLTTPSTRRFSIQACLATERKDWFDCCNLGSRFGGEFTFDQKNDSWAKNLILPVLTERAYYVHIGEGTFGPFTPSPTTHDIVTSLAIVAPKAKDKSQTIVEERAPPEPSEPGEKDPKASVGAVIVDATTRERIPTARLQLKQRVGKGRSYSLDSKSGEAFVAEDAPPGAWLVSARAQGYAPSPPMEVLFEADRHHDLGRIALEPHPIYEGILVDAQGDPIEGVRLRLTNGEFYHLAMSTKTDAQGNFQFRTQMPSSVCLQLSHEDMSHVFHVQSWTPDSPEKLRCPPLHQVEITLQGVAEELLPALRGLEVTKAFAGQSGETKHLPVAQTWTFEPGAGPTAIARFKLPKGSYRLLLRSGLFRLSHSDLVVTDSPVQRFPFPLN